jgi:hypothetical protein
MKKNILNNIILLAAFFVIFTGSAMAANYNVTVDCYHSSIRDTDTGNRITVSFLDNNRRLIRNVSRNGIRNCVNREASFSLNTNRIVRYLTFSTNGNDAFYIDEWRLFVDGRRIGGEGTDNGRGWCLSTDSRDSIGAWRRYITGSCQPRITFPVAGSGNTGGNTGGRNNYRLTVDCFHNSIRNTDTGNRISVSFRDRNRNLIQTVSRNSIRNCTGNGPTFSINTNRIVEYVEFSTNGNDAFFIDQWSLFRGRQRITSQGVDNGQGWCLSTDRRDAVTEWRGYVTGGCQSRLSFPISGSGTGGGGNTGNTNYRLAIDCSHNSIINTETNNRITVSFLDRNGRVIRSVSKNGIRNCRGNEPTFSINTNQVVQYVEFSTNGNDGFYIDEWRLFRNNQRISQNGVNNGQGWCLSTDRNDAFGEWNGYVTGGCQSRIRFPLTGGGGNTGNNNLYRVEVDCNHNSIRDTDTGNRITVQFMRSNRSVIRSISRNGIRNCNRGASTFSIRTNENVRYINFLTNGNDAFYIDEWRLFRGGRLIQRQGRDNGRGWCLSTDTNDAFGPWRNYVSNGCRRNQLFTVTGG